MKILIGFVYIVVGLLALISFGYLVQLFGSLFTDNEDFAFLAGMLMLMSFSAGLFLSYLVGYVIINNLF